MHTGLVAPTPRRDNVVTLPAAERGCYTRRMTKRHALALTLLLGCSLLGCAGMKGREPAMASGPSATDPADLDRLFAERANAGDVDGLVALYEPTAALLRPDGTAAVGHEAIRTELQGLVTGKMRLVMNIDRVVRTGDVATVYNDWVGTGTGPDGKPVSMKGGAIEVARRQEDGTWRYVLDDPYARSRKAPQPAPAKRSKRR